MINQVSIIGNWLHSTPMHYNALHISLKPRITIRALSPYIQAEVRTKPRTTSFCPACTHSSPHVRYPTVIGTLFPNDSPTQLPISFTSFLPLKALCRAYILGYSYFFRV